MSAATSSSVRASLWRMRCSITRNCVLSRSSTTSRTDPERAALVHDAARLPRGASRARSRHAGRGLRGAEDRRRCLVAECQRRNIPVANHDDTKAAHVGDAARLGMRPRSRSPGGGDRRQGPWHDDHLRRAQSGAWWIAHRQRRGRRSHPGRNGRRVCPTISRRASCRRCSRSPRRHSAVAAIGRRTCLGSAGGTVRSPTAGGSRRGGRLTSFAFASSTACRRSIRSGARAGLSSAACRSRARDRSRQEAQRRSRRSPGDDG